MEGVVCFGGEANDENALSGGGGVTDIFLTGTTTPAFPLAPRGDFGCSFFVGVCLRLSGGTFVVFICCCCCLVSGGEWLWGVGCMSSDVVVYDCVDETVNIDDEFSLSGNEVIFNGAEYDEDEYELLLRLPPYRSSLMSTGGTPAMLLGSAVAGVGETAGDATCDIEFDGNDFDNRGDDLDLGEEEEDLDDDDEYEDVVVVVVVDDRDDLADLGDGVEEDEDEDTVDLGDGDCDDDEEEEEEEEYDVVE